MVDGIPLILIPDSYLPDNVSFIVTHPVATVSPIKLSEYKIHDNPPGINGWLVEGRLYYDTFILNNKKSAIYVHCTPEEAQEETPEPTLGELTVTSTASETSGKTAITITPAAQSGNSFVYKTLSSKAPEVEYNQDLSSWTAIESGDEITATTGHKITVAEVDAENKAVKAGSTSIVSGE